MRFYKNGFPWKKKRLKDFCVINPRTEDLDEEFVYIDLESVSKGVLLNENIISKDGAPSRAQRVLENNDILFQCVRPYQMNNLFFRGLHNHLQYVASTGYAQIRTKEYPPFVYHLLHSPNFNKNVMLRCTGSSYPAIASGDLEDIETFICDKEEQQKIGLFLDAIDHRIAVQNKIIKGRKSLILSLVFRTFCDVLTIISDFASGNALGGILNLLQLFRTIFKEVKQMVTQKNIGQIADLWKADKKQFVKKSTYAAYSLIVDTHILPAFGDKTNVGEKDVQEFVLQKLNGGLSQKTIKDMLIVLRMILKFGAKKNYCAYTPFDVIFPTDRERQELEVLSITNQKKIMRYVEENFTFRNLGIFVCLSTGMRIGKICALTWDDIDTENGVIHIRKTLQRIYIRENEIRRTELVIDSPKTATSIRDIPMTKDLLSVLKPLRKVVNEQYFVLTNDITPTEPRTYRNYYKKLLAKLEIPPIKFHGLRHSFATRCIESHCDYKTVSVILGHSNISTTLNLYVHPNYEQKKKCIDKMLKSLK